jgi:glycosyltransferase involved in cell wall biosynthesis
MSGSSTAHAVTMTTAPLRYVVVTPARNEGKYIRRTLESMVAQTHLPLRWVIVSDGSTDDTDEIVKEYARRRDWIELVRLPEQRDRSFAAKVQGFESGFARVRQLPFDLVASLDADIEFEPDYFEFLLAKFADNPRLGVGGTPFVEGNRHYNFEYSNIEHVSGACQVFRRECYEQIGGYQRIKGGGIDWTAVTTARMKGWQTRTFTEKTCLHLRPMGTGSRSILSVNFHHGQRDYYLGGHPLWQVFRCTHQLARPPYVFGGASLLVGYFWAAVRRVKRPVSDELVRFHRAEQMTRLKRFFGRFVSRRDPAHV